MEKLTWFSKNQAAPIKESERINSILRKKSNLILKITAKHNFTTNGMPYGCAVKAVIYNPSTIVCKDISQDISQDIMVHRILIHSTSLVQNAR